MKATGRRKWCYGSFIIAQLWRDRSETNQHSGDYSIHHSKNPIENNDIKYIRAISSSHATPSQTWINQTTHSQQYTTQQKPKNHTDRQESPWVTEPNTGRRQSPPKRAEKPYTHKERNCYQTLLPQKRRLPFVNHIQVNNKTQQTFNSCT